MSPGYVPADAAFPCGENSVSAGNNLVNAFMIQGVILPPQQLEQLLKTVSGIALCQFRQQMNHRFIAPGIGLVNIDRPAQR